MRTITQDQRLQLIGLMTLARGYARKMQECEQAMHAIVQDPEIYGGHFSDAVFGERTIDELLKLKLKIKGIEVV